jgi:hypothetical protein
MGKQYSLTFDKQRFVKPSVLTFAAHTTPVFKEVRGEEYIMFGEKNNYPNYLIDLYNKSAKHNSIVNAKVKYTSGAGYDIDKAAEGWESLQAFLDEINSDGESFEDVLYKTNLDLEIFGGYYLEVIWSKSGKSIASIKHLDFSHVRSDKDNETFFYTKNWLDAKGKPNRDVKESEDFTVYSAFDTESRKGAQVFSFKRYRPNVDVYATPEYTGAIEYIEIDTLISNHHYNNIKNGFVGNVMINFLNGVPTEEEQEVIEKRIQEKFTGSEGQRVLINFADGEDSATKIDFLTPPDAYKMFTELSKSVEQEILTGHSMVSGMLLGIKSEGQLGGRQEMIDAYELMKSTYVDAKQKILERSFNHLFKFGYTSTIELQSNTPLSMQFGEATLKEVMTKDEIREKSGLPVDSDAVVVNANPTVDALNALNDGVAAKVLESMTPDEIRGLAGLEAREVQMKFRTEEVMSVFDEYGEKKENFNIVSARGLSFVTMTEAQSSEQRILEFADQYTALERGVMDLLIKDELMNAKDMAKALKSTEKEVAKTLEGLVKSGDIKVNKSTGANKVTESGVRVVEEKPSKVADIYVKYSYEVIAGMGKPIIETTRDFCRDLIRKDKLYTRDEIEKISSRVGYNVFEMRGGWMTKRGTDISVPHCRHQWQQVIVTRK